ncbi:hypothetical protein QNH14_06740 [Apirhabdus apintestini]|nr:hypothetical protein QNH14_06740 [Enterobacteriaceae bacterium CA-0114]
MDQFCTVGNTKRFPRDMTLLMPHSQAALVPISNTEEQCWEGDLQGDQDIKPTVSY